jgi:hypothetical protein
MDWRADPANLGVSIQTHFALEIGQDQRPD